MYLGGIHLRYRTVVLSTILTLLTGILLVLFYTYFALVGKLPVISEQITNPKGITHILSIYGYGKKPEELLNNPTGVATDRKGRIFISDAQHGRVLIFDRRGSFLGRLGIPGNQRGQIYRPDGIDAGRDGTVYVCDPGRNAVLAFDSDLKFKNEVGEQTPLAVFDTGSRLYILGYDHLSIYDKSFRLLKKIGKRGKEIGDFDFPHGIAVLKNGDIAVSDGNNMRLVAYKKGTNRAAWVVGEPPEKMDTKQRKFGLPVGIALDDDENIYVMDALRHTVHIYSPTGKKLAEYGEMGSREGEFNYPSDIAYLGGDTFAISDTMNNRVQIIRIAVPAQRQ